MKKLFFLICLLGAFAPAMAQHALSGQVVSAADNSPLPGASVRLKDAATGGITNHEGYFTLPVTQQTGVLQVSFLGFESQEYAYTLPLPEPLVLVLLPAPQGLQEVVVSTGYQQLPRERATGSFAQVDKATFQEQAGPDVLSRLEAVANGLTVNRAGFEPQLLVRGLSSINGAQSPLIVVDNFPYEGDITNINPNDVESITILRDAAAASIWGARAGNGVIVITTRKGRYNQPLSVDLNANVTVVAKPDLSYLRPISASDFIDVEQSLFDKGYYDSQLNAVNRPELSPVVEILARRRNGTLSPEEADARINALRQVDVRDEFDRHMYQQAVRQQYALNLRSGSDVLAWSLAAGYDRNTDELDATYNRLSLRFQNTLRPHRNLTLTTGAFYTQSESGSGKPGYGQIGNWNNNLYPYARFADENGTPLPLHKDFTQAYKDTVGGGRLKDWNYYPLEDYRHARSTTTLQDVTANFGLQYTWRHGLSGDVKYQYERQQTAGQQLYGEESYFARDFVNRYAQLPPGTGAARYVVPGGGILDQTGTLLASRNLRGQLNLDKSWGDHTVAAILGAEMRHARVTGFRSRLYGYDPERLTFGGVDYTTRYPHLVTGGLLFIPDNSNRDHRTDRFLSQYANASYTFRDRYTVSLSARRDASNLFGLNTNDRWNPLWSSGLSWEISKEPFYRSAFLPYLKLRSTYGYSGSTNPAFTAVSTLFYVATSPYTQSTYARFSNYANPDLSWETVGMWNVGLDFGTKNNRLTGSLEYYRKRAFDLLALYPVDYTTGVGSQVMRNVASMAGRGADLELKSRNLDRAVQWTSQLNLSLNREKVTDYYLGESPAYRYVTPGYRFTGETGKPLYAVYSYKWAGLDPQTGNPQGFVDGEVSQDYFAIVYGEAKLDDLQYHGSALPTAFGSLGNTVSWKRLSLTARISWKLGYYFRASSIQYGSLFDAWGGHADYARRWQQPGDERTTDVPSLSYPNDGARDVFYAGSEVLVEKGDHVRLQYITAAYDVLRPDSGRKTFKNMQAYVNLGNLGILWRSNRKGLDPDVSALNALPQPPSLSIGLKATL